jgi:predicted nucleic acid-binding protein
VIVLDTNVISELVRPQPDRGVLGWLDRYPWAEVYLTAITAAELRYGVARLADGRRRTDLAERVRRLTRERFARRVLPFDDEAASHYAEVVASREARGMPIGVADVQIAAICLSHGAALATRNTKDFVHTDIGLINPWESEPTT